MAAHPGYAAHQPPVRRRRPVLRAAGDGGHQPGGRPERRDGRAARRCTRRPCRTCPGGSFVGPDGFMEQRGHPARRHRGGQGLRRGRLAAAVGGLRGADRRALRVPGAARRRDRPAARRRRRAGVGRALPGAGRRAAGAGAGRAGRDPRPAAGAARPRSPSRSPPCCATSTRSCCPGSPTGSTRATSRTSPPARPSRRSSPSCWRRRSTRWRSCGGRRRPRPSSRASCSTGWPSCSGCPRGWHGHIEDSASTSTLAAMIAAREATGRDLVVCSEQAHSSVEKAARMLGHAAAQGAVRRRSSGCGPDALGDLARGRRRRGHGRHDRDDLGRSGAGDRRRVRARPARGCTSTPPTPARRWSAPSSGGRSPASSAPTRWSSTPTSGCSPRWTARCCGPAGPRTSARAFSLIPEYLRTPDAEDALSLSEYGPALGPPVPRAEAVGGAALPRPQRACRSTSAAGSSWPQQFEQWVARRAGLGAVRAAAVLGRLLPARRRRRPQPGAARAGQRQRRDLPLARGAERALRAAAGRRAACSTTEEDVRRAWDVLRREAARSVRREALLAAALIAGGGSATGAAAAASDPDPERRSRSAAGADLRRCTPAHGRTRSRGVRADSAEPVHGRQRRSRRSTTTRGRPTPTPGAARSAASRRRSRLHRAGPRLRLDHLRPARARDLGLRRRSRARAVHVRPEHAGDAGHVLAAAAHGGRASSQRLPGLHRRRLLLPRQPRPGRHRDHHPAHLRDRRDVGGPGSRSSHDYDLSSSCTSNEEITSALPDSHGLLWFVAQPGRRRRHAELRRPAPMHVVRLGNGASARSRTRWPPTRSGGVYIATNRKLYRFAAGPTARRRISWSVDLSEQLRAQARPGRRRHRHDAEVMPGGYVGITTTPTRWTWSSTARRRTRTCGSRQVCRVPVFAKGASADENSMIAAGRSIPDREQLRLSEPAVGDGGKMTAPGFARVDINAKGTGCRRCGRTRPCRRRRVVSKLSLANGLIYTYTTDAGSSSPWYWTALDFRTGRLVYKVLAGTGLGYNNNYAGIALSPAGTEYLGMLGGIALLRDGAPPPRRQASASTPRRRPRSGRVDQARRSPVDARGYSPGRVAQGGSGRGGAARLSCRGPGGWGRPDLPADRHPLRPGHGQRPLPGQLGPVLVGYATRAVPGTRIRIDGVYPVRALHVVEHLRPGPATVRQAVRLRARSRTPEAPTRSCPARPRNTPTSKRRYTLFITFSAGRPSRAQRHLRRSPPAPRRGPHAARLCPDRGRDVDRRGRPPAGDVGVDHRIAPARGTRLAVRLAREADHLDRSPARTRTRAVPRAARRSRGARRRTGTSSPTSASPAAICCSATPVGDRVPQAGPNPCAQLRHRRLPVEHRQLVRVRVHHPRVRPDRRLPRQGPDVRQHLSGCAATMPRNVQLRYWSFCQNDPFSERYVACARDDQVKKFRGNYTIVIAPPVGLAGGRAAALRGRRHLHPLGAAAPGRRPVPPDAARRLVRAGDQERRLRLRGQADGRLLPKGRYFSSWRGVAKAYCSPAARSARLAGTPVATQAVGPHSARGAARCTDCRGRRRHGCRAAPASQSLAASGSRPQLLQLG